MSTSPATSSTLLRRALQGNDAFSTVSGILFIIAAKPIAAFLGPVQPWMLVGAGVGLLGFAAWVAHNSLRDLLSALETRMIIAGDLMWVAGSLAAVLYANALGLTRGGTWAIILIADVVLLFAVLQFLGLRKLRGVRAH